jgi:sulfate transport system substrate-binding protein
MRTTLVRLIAGLALVVALAVVAVGCGGGSDKLSLVAYSTPKEAYEALIPEFQKTKAGKGVDFSQSYGPSGDQSRAVDGGLKADVVEFSLETDVTRLVDSGIVAKDWQSGPNKGIVTDSVVVLAVRKGNPKHIKGWADLVEPGVDVITPNPFSSGGARWNVMAAYGAQLEQGKSEAEAVKYLEDLFKNVSVQDKSAREALQTFTGGKGDVLISYENEAITAQQKGEDLDYVVPDETILIENPVAVTKDASKDAKAFVKFLYTPKAQGIFAEKGYRPVVKGAPGAGKYPTPKKLFEITKFGGWAPVVDKFFDPDKGIVAGIEKSLNEPTE